MTCEKARETWKGDRGSWGVLTECDKDREEQTPSQGGLACLMWGGVRKAKLEEMMAENKHQKYRHVL
jgi:hypothetical protein